MRHCYVYDMATPRFPRRIFGACTLALVTLLAAAAEPPATPVVPAQPEPAAEPTLLVNDLVKGVGDEALPGMSVIVHYTGWLFDPVAKDHKGRKFDSSHDRKQPLSFPLGSGHEIAGW